MILAVMRIPTSFYGSVLIRFDLGLPVDQIIGLVENAIATKQSEFDELSRPPERSIDDEISAAREALADLVRIGINMDSNTQAIRTKRAALKDAVGATHRRQDGGGAIIFDFATVSQRKPLWRALHAIEIEHGAALSARVQNNGEIKQLQKTIEHLYAVQEKQRA